MEMEERNKGKSREKIGRQYDGLISGTKRNGRNKEKRRIYHMNEHNKEI